MGNQKNFDAKKKVLKAINILLMLKVTFRGNLNFTDVKITFRGN